jgi:hypothetical protein
MADQQLAGKVSSPVCRARKQSAPGGAAAEEANQEPALPEFRCEKCKHGSHGGVVVGRRFDESEASQEIDHSLTLPFEVVKQASDLVGSHAAP